MSAQFGVFYAFLAILHLVLAFTGFAMPSRGLKYFWAWQLLMAVAWGILAIHRLRAKP